MFLNYRKYRSLGTPTRLTFQARLLHNQEGDNAEKGGFPKRAVFERSRRQLFWAYGSMFASFWLWSNRAWKVSLGGMPRLRYLGILVSDTFKTCPFYGYAKREAHNINWSPHDNAKAAPFTGATLRTIMVALCR